MMVQNCAGVVSPTGAQKKNLVMAFAKRDMIIYGKAFDLVRLSAPVDLGSLEDIDRNFDAITILEVKSTKKDIAGDFTGHFFSLTSAEVLVAQSLKHRFKFVFVNTNNGAFVEMSMSQVFAKARGIYPSWSIMF